MPVRSLLRGRQDSACILRDDDGNVVVMVSVMEYLAMDETNHPQELRWGTVVREPAAPSFSHQRIVARLVAKLEVHVMERGLGLMVPSPIDVVLDVQRALVLQPDVAFVRAERREMCRERIWGAPDLVVEVLSDATRRRDRLAKTAWYRDYGVRECWLVDPVSRQVTIADRVFEGTMRIESAVLPDLSLTVDAVFGESEYIRV